MATEMDNVIRDIYALLIKHGLPVTPPKTGAVTVAEMQAAIASRIGNLTVSSKNWTEG